MSNSLKINFAHLQYGVSNVGHETQRRGRSLWSCLQASCPGGKAQGPIPQPSEENGIPYKNCSASPSDAVSPRLFTRRLCQTRFCRGVNPCRLQGSPAPGRPGLWQLLHNDSENQPHVETGCLITAKWSCDGIPRQLSHCPCLDLSLPHISLGFLKESELFFPLKMCRSSWIEWEGRRINLRYVSSTCKWFVINSKGNPRTQRNFCYPLKMCLCLSPYEKAAAAFTST